MLILFCCAVYDGHGGGKVATHVSRHLHRHIVRRPEYKNGDYEEAIIKVCVFICNSVGIILSTIQSIGRYSFLSFLGFS